MANSKTPEAVTLLGKLKTGRQLICFFDPTTLCMYLDSSLDEAREIDTGAMRISHQDGLITIALLSGEYAGEFTNTMNGNGSGHSENNRFAFKNVVQEDQVGTIEEESEVINHENGNGSYKQSKRPKLTKKQKRELRNQLKEKEKARRQALQNPRTPISKDKIVFRLPG